MKFLASELSKSVLARLAFGFFAVLAAWWVSMYIRGLQEGVENNYFTLIYPWLSLFGGVTGLMIARQWGGFKSHFGRAASLLSLGLLAQFFGQVAYAYYIYVLGVEVPYPSVGDVGYFGSVIFYIAATYFLGHTAGVRFNLRNYKGKVVAIILPLLMLSLAFLTFLRGYDPESSGVLRTFLDFGYPLGQAVYVSFAMLAFILSTNVLGGVMRKPIMFLIFALVVQYIADAMFLYQANAGTWYVGGTNDFVYLLSYLLMSLSLIHIGLVYKRISNS